MIQRLGRSGSRKNSRHNILEGSRGTLVQVQASIVPSRRGHVPMRDTFTLRCPRFHCPLLSRSICLSLSLAPSYRPVFISDSSWVGVGTDCVSTLTVCRSTSINPVPCYLNHETRSRSSFTCLLDFMAFLFLSFFLSSLFSPYLRLWFIV